MVIFHSYVKLPEGKNWENNLQHVICWENVLEPCSTANILDNRASTIENKEFIGLCNPQKQDITNAYIVDMIELTLANGRYNY